MWDFGRAELLEPEAIGEPGQRTFRLRVMSGTEAASLWLEKEHLIALTLAIRQLLEQATEDDAEEDEALPLGDFPARPQVEFKLGKLGIGYDENKQMVTIFAYERDEEDENASPTFACQISRRQCRTFAEQAEETIAAGRPICVLCGGPINADGNHVCLRRNGHSTLPISLANEDTDE
jgi:uncharacterized repeat protein (TIGR03847 family)